MSRFGSTQKPLIWYKGVINKRREEIRGGRV
jgi:hypothetical protein